jgi:NAD(P)H-hydrate epimerase
MTALEQRLFASGLPVEALMEKAALAVSRRVMAMLRPRQGSAADGAGSTEGVRILAGPGHNGGDGLVVARELHLAGIPVTIWSPFQRRKPLTETHLRHARWLGIPLAEAEPDPADPALWVDALFGVGQSRPPGEAIEALLARRQIHHPGALVAIDTPTGLCSDTGRVLGTRAATASVTYCLGLLKQGLVQDRALVFVGRLERIDLGMPEALLADLPADQPLALGSTPEVAAEDRAHAPWPPADPAASKYARGRLLVVAGSSRYRGAAHLALLGATASGCGSLRACLPRELADDLWMIHPHVVQETSLGSTASGGLDLTDLRPDWLERLDAVLLGPGLGAADPIGEEGAGALVSMSRADGEPWRALQAFEGLLVLDADGLNRLAESTTGMGSGAESGIAWLRGRGGPTWITPHPGEFARLFPDLASTPPLEAAAAAACRSGSVVLLKGAHSVVAAPDGRRWQVLQAAPEAARAGLGDVLAGYVAGRGAMAMTSAPLDAALLAAAALEHALAGLRCRRRRGPGGVTPMAVGKALMQRSTA